MLSEAGDKFRLYEEELISWNARMNLTSITDKDDIRAKHFSDSLSIAMAFDLASGPVSVLDIGTGAGFPGIPLKIKYPNIDLTLVDSTKKKTEFLEHVVASLGLECVSVVNKRAEELGDGMKEKFDLVVSRAVADLNVLSELCLPYVRVGGMFIAMKAKDAAEEATRSQKAIKELGGELSRIIKADVPGLEAERNLVIIKKVAPTPAKYPRRSGMPAKRPLS